MHCIAERDSSSCIAPHLVLVLQVGLVLEQGFQGRCIPLQDGRAERRPPLVTTVQVSSRIYMDRKWVGDLGQSGAETTAYKGVGDVDGSWVGLSNTAMICTLPVRVARCTGVSSDCTAASK